MDITTTKKPDGKEYMSVRINAGIKNAIKEIADAERRSLSSMVTIMLERAVEQTNAKQ